MTIHKNETNQYVNPKDVPFIKMARSVTVFMASSKKTYEKIFEKPKTIYKPWQRMLNNLNSYIESGAKNDVGISQFYIVFILAIFVLTC